MLDYLYNLPIAFILEVWYTIINLKKGDNTMWFEYYIYLVDTNEKTFMQGRNEEDVARRAGLDAGQYDVIMSYPVER